MTSDGRITWSPEATNDLLQAVVDFGDLSPAKKNHPIGTIQNWDRVMKVMVQKRPEHTRDAVQQHWSRSVKKFGPQLAAMTFPDKTSSATKLATVAGLRLPGNSAGRSVTAVAGPSVTAAARNSRSGKQPEASSARVPAQEDREAYLRAMSGEEREAAFDKAIKDLVILQNIKREATMKGSHK